ncbi:hypothetical protein DFJ74DRAFT_683180 [Hyaloraphidium curvatum]|nr:hypothetical protein DFJ74DRAFT_683180 [Hyaloraphidium curvatum]
MGKIQALPRASNGGYAGPDPKLSYDPLDARRPAVDLAAPTEEEVEVMKLAPPPEYPEGKEIRRVEVACIGTGMCGITVAMLAQWRLRNVSLKIFEKNKKPTGTWHENKYPGCRCDVPAHMYVWRFEPNRWSSVYAGTDEIELYFKRMIEKYNVDAFTTYGAEVVSATWSEARAAWRLEVRTADGVQEDWAHVVLNGHGILNRPKIPTFEGEGSFKGVVMHTARFDRSVPLEGKRVAVIGNGSSGIQTIGSIGSKVKELHSYQRTPTWITNLYGGTDGIDAHVYSDEERAFFADRKNAYEFYLTAWKAGANLFALFKQGTPEAEAAIAAGRAHLEKHVHDPELRKILTPSYPVGCRRLTPHEHYLEALQLPTTKVINSPIERFTDTGIVAGGVERPCDVIIKATGFDVTYTPHFPVTGRGGKTLAEEWTEFPWSYKSVLSHGFPGFFHVMGPNSPVAQVPIHLVEEQQVAYAVQVIVRMQTEGIVAVDPKLEVQRKWHEGIQEDLRGTVWEVDCGGWYKNQNKHGVLTSHWPGLSTEFMAMIQSPDWDEFDLTYLKDLKDPAANVIEAKFGADVEKVAEMGPPAEPKV